MLRIPLARNVFTYRTQLRVLLFAGIAVLIAWWAFTSFSARLDKSSKQAKGSSQTNSCFELPVCLKGQNEQKT